MIGIGATDVGLGREVNQDCFVCKQLSPTVFYSVVCDGMGGENGGQVASKVAMEAIAAQLDIADFSGMTSLSIKETISAAVAKANRDVHEQGKASHELNGMGTTTVVLVVVNKMAYIGYAGDSRAYLYSPVTNIFTQLTRDHTVVQMLMDSGDITPEEMLTHPQRHYITRAVGVEPTVDITFREHLLTEKECLLLCSDGLYNFVPEENLPILMMKAVAEHSANCFIDAANAGGGGDNITAVIVSYLLTEGTANG